MNIRRELTDTALLGELGRRFAARRIALSLPQAELAGKAGVSTRTLIRFESGSSIQLTALLRIMRELDLLNTLEALVPEAGPGPIDMLHLRDKQRRRAPRNRNKAGTRPWTWSDDR